MEKEKRKKEKCCTRHNGACFPRKAALKNFKILYG